MSKTAMTKATAQALVERQRTGQPVNAVLLQEALCCLKRGHDRFHLPALPDATRAHVNAVLAFNLGLAIGRARGAA
jgi:hypothetical protein